MTMDAKVVSATLRVVCITNLNVIPILELVIVNKTLKASGVTAARPVIFTLMRITNLDAHPVSVMGTLPSAS